VRGAGEVVLRPSTNPNGAGIVISDRDWVSVRTLIVDGSLLGTYFGGAFVTGTRSPYRTQGIIWDRVTVRNCRIQSSGGFAASGSAYTPTQHPGLKYLGCTSSNNGSAGHGHGYYVYQAGAVLDGCTADGNAGHGIHIYHESSISGSDQITITNCSVRANGSYGIGIYRGDSILVVNNVIWGNGADASLGATGGIRVGAYANNAKIYNNTVYSNTGHGIKIEGSSTTPIIANNILHANSVAQIRHEGAIGGITLANNLTNDPGFVDPPADFRLTPGSCAIDAGMTIAEVVADRDGMGRPQGRGYDLGAYEFRPVPRAPGPPEQLRLIGR
jgi:parallel beta-helix repeat protein